MKNTTSWLLELLEFCKISKEEFNYRKQELEKAQQEPKSDIGSYSVRYYNLAHEFKSLAFLQQFGNVSVAKDYKHQPGCDCLLNEHYQIECVCSSAGKSTDGIDLLGKKDKDLKFYVGNYNEALLLCRLTTSIDKKLGFFNDHMNKTISIKRPYIIFLGLGELSNEIFAGDNGISFTGMLFGKGCPIVTIDMETGLMTPKGYAHNNIIYNHNHSPINCNIFSAEKYRCVSGIIISAAKLYEKYTLNNTWLFINPYACAKITPEDFPNLVYWDLYCESEYGPYKNGKRMA